MDENTTLTPILSPTGQPVKRARHRLPRWHYLAAIVAGALNTLSFAPTPHGGWLELAIFAFLYFWLTRTTGWKSALFTGWAFGLGNFVSGIWWLYVSMHFYGGMPAVLALAALVLFALYLGFYPALAAVLWSLCAGRARGAHRGKTAALADNKHPFAPTWPGAFAFASAWAVGEWLRGTVFTGFPWLASGYAQVDGPLAGFAPLVGVYGVGWALALVAALLVQTAVSVGAVGARNGNGKNKNSPGDEIYPRAGTVGAVGAFAPALIAVVIIAAGSMLAQVAWTTPTHTSLSVRLLQGNIKQEMKFEEAGIIAAMNEFQRLITEKPADLTVTPETAIPILHQDDPNNQDTPNLFELAIRSFSDTSGTAVLFGELGTMKQEHGVTGYTNSLFGVTPGVQKFYRYDKHHLVPFGEFVPWGFRWFVDLMHIPLGDFARGAPVQPPFIVHGQPIGTDICYEDIFGEEIARTVRESTPSPVILVNATNLAWFGDTIALDQHLQIARMRALETGRPMLRATNTGTTAAIDAHGRVIAKLAPYTVGSLNVHIEGTTGFTPYVMSGNTIVLAVSLLLLASGFSLGRLRGKEKSSR